VRIKRVNPKPLGARNEHGSLGYRHVRTVPVFNERGKQVGLVEPESGILYTNAGNLSLIQLETRGAALAGLPATRLNRHHRARRGGADRRGVVVSAECERWEERGT